MFLAKCNFANWYVSCLDKTRKEALSAPSIKVSKRVAQFLSFQKEAQHAALFSLRLYGLSDTVSHFRLGSFVPFKNALNTFKCCSENSNEIQNTSGPFISINPH